MGYDLLAPGFFSFWRFLFRSDLIGPDIRILYWFLLAIVYT